MYYFIINPNSRSGTGLRIWRQLEQQLKNQQISYQAYLTEYVGHARKLAHALSDSAVPRTIVVLGGDGTVNEVLDGLILSDHITLGYIPAGSGNDFARGLGIPQNPRKALDCILHHGQIREIRLGQVKADGKTHRFGTSTGIGYDASICHENLSSPLKKMLNRLHLGKLSYVLIGIRQFFLWKPAAVTLYLDDRRRLFFPKTYFAAAMNLPCEGGGFRFCPKASPDTPYLDVCVAENITKGKFICLLPLAFFGRHTRFQGVHLYRCRKLVIQCAVLLPVHRDGESGGYQSELIINLENMPLKVIVPVI